MTKSSLKIFISYSHKNESDLEKFSSHLAPLKNNNLISEWFDRKIIAGQDYKDEIDNNLRDADIICLLISADFLSSTNCKNEIRDSLELKKRKGVTVIPIIVHACGWKECADISNLLALPTDGKHITEFNSQDDYWQDVYSGLKTVIEKICTISNLKNHAEFTDFLNEADLFTKAHNNKNNVFLRDIFVYPELEKYNNLRGHEKEINSRDLVDELFMHPKILLAGQNQSGKTALCKMIFLSLLEAKFVPIYLCDKENRYQGDINKKIEKAFSEQYLGASFSEIDKDRIIPILDDFYFAKKKENIISRLAEYNQQIIIVDDVYNLNLKNEQLISDYRHYKIKEWKPSQRYELIKKWISLSDDKEGMKENENETYQGIDKQTELINAALGKTIGNGIMPAYPFFILSVIRTDETLSKPLDQEITSQGYCYQALIFIYLRKQGVKSDEVDIYINFLTEFANLFYLNKKSEISKDEFEEFMKEYNKKFNLPIAENTLISNLEKTQIIKRDSFSNYSFHYPYLYYFFVAKYFSDQASKNKTEIKNIFNNLHKDENAYIAIFISHHSKDSFILEHMIEVGKELFSKYKPSTLSVSELTFFDKEFDSIIEAAMPNASESPEKERERRLKIQDKIEHDSSTEKDREKIDELEIRRSVKTVEVMGFIIKNRAGSLEKTDLKLILKEAMDVHLRVLTAFFELIKNPSEQLNMIELIKSNLEEINRKKGGRLSSDKIEKYGKKIFWNINFLIAFGAIDKMVHSLGSKNLSKIIEEVCTNENTPAYHLFNQGSLLWYNKSLRFSDIHQILEQGDFSKISRRCLEFMIVNYCSLHQISHKDSQRVEREFGIKPLELRMSKKNSS